jgi:hypothetical protein
VVVRIERNEGAGKYVACKAIAQTFSYATDFDNVTLGGHTIVQSVTRWFPTAAAWARARA